MNLNKESPRLAGAKKAVLDESAGWGGTTAAGNPCPPAAVVQNAFDCRLTDGWWAAPRRLIRADGVKGAFPHLAVTDRDAHAGIGIAPDAVLADPLDRPDMAVAMLGEDGGPLRTGVARQVAGADAIKPLVLLDQVQVPVVRTQGLGP